jgi:hypothetical protein
MDEVSSEGEAGGVSGAECIEEGVVGLVEMDAANLKIGAVADGGVGGSRCIGRGEGGSCGIDSTDVAIVRGQRRRGGMAVVCDATSRVRRNRINARR